MMQNYIYNHKIKKKLILRKTIIMTNRLFIKSKY